MVNDRAGGSLAAMDRSGQKRAGRGLLTEREREVLTLTAAGKGDKVVAAQLRISERTVRFHLSECKRRLGATTRAQAIVIAIGLGEIRTSVKSAVRPKD